MNTPDKVDKAHALLDPITDRRELQSILWLVQSKVEQQLKAERHVLKMGHGFTANWGRWYGSSWWWFNLFSNARNGYVVGLDLRLFGWFVSVTFFRKTKHLEITQPQLNS